MKNGLKVASFVLLFHKKNYWGKRPKIEVILHTKKQYNASFVPVFVCSSSLLLCNLVLTQNPFFYFYYIN